MENCWVLRNCLLPLRSFWKSQGSTRCLWWCHQLQLFRQAGPRQLSFVLNQRELGEEKQQFLTRVADLCMSVFSKLPFTKVLHLCWWLEKLLLSEL